MSNRDQRAAARDSKRSSQNPSPVQTPIVLPTPIIPTPHTPPDEEDEDEDSEESEDDSEQEIERSLPSEHAPMADETKPGGSNEPTVQPIIVTPLAPKGKERGDTEPPMRQITQKEYNDLHDEMETMRAALRNRPQGRRDRSERSPSPLRQPRRYGDDSDDEEDSKIKFPKPPSYDGTRNGPAREFIRKCELYFLANARPFRSGKSRVRFALFLLTDRAASWASPILTAHIERPNSALGSHVNWDQFKLEFALTFIDLSDKRAAQRELLTIKQTSSASDYMSRFNEVATRAECTEVQTLITFFYNGLKEHVKDSLAQIVDVFDDFNSYAQLCIALDTRHFEREKERKHVTRASGNQSTSRTTSSPSTTSNSTPAKKVFSKKKGPLTQEEKDGRRARGECLYCGKKGHFASDCPEAKKKKEVASLTPAEDAKIEEDFAERA